MDAQQLLTAVCALDPSAKPREKADRPAVQVPVETLLKFMRRLHDDPALSFDVLYTHTAIDWLAEGRFELVYQLYSMKYRHYLMVTASVPREKPVAPSVSSIWRIAEWQEREAYDLLGILYDGHKDLRRLFLEDDWQGFPLRKDYQDDFMLELP